MKKILQLTLALSVVAFLGCGGSDGGDDDPGTGTPSIAIPTGGATSPLSRSGYTLLWNDEFDGTALNAANWTHELGTGTDGWGNAELQYYRPNNTTLQDGHLIITAKEESIEGSNYTSSRIISQNKFDFQYGRVDIRAALPEGKGMWPALWMLGSNFASVGWPQCGEIDIMEKVGGPGLENEIHGTVHWQAETAYANFGGSVNLSSNTTSQFHVYSVEWTATEIRWFVDDVQYHVIDTRPGHLDEFRRNFFFILNVAVGGRWPGSPDATTTFPQHMFVDYVRVFQEN